MSRYDNTHLLYSVYCAVWNIGMDTVQTRMESRRRCIAYALLNVIAIAIKEGKL